MEKKSSSGLIILAVCLFLLIVIQWPVSMGTLKRLPATLDFVVTHVEFITQHPFLISLITIPLDWLKAVLIVFFMPMGTLFKATVLLGMILTVTCLAEAENIPVVGGKESCPVVAIWRDDHGNAPTKDFGPFVIMAIWQDGTVIWSKDNVRGGPPYFRGNIDPDGLESVLQGLAADEAFVVPYAYQNNFGPDSFFTAVYLFHKGLAFFSRSWHEMAEQDPEVVAVSYGLTALDGKSREEFLKDDKEDYLKYRQMWERIRRAITSLLPEKGEETFVEFEMKDVESEVAVEVDNPRR